MLNENAIENLTRKRYPSCNLPKDKTFNNMLFLLGVRVDYLYTQIRG